jgi:hypothetical protein
MQSASKKQAKGSVHPAYNPSFSACFFSRNSIFSHKKSVNSVFQPAYQHSRTGPKVTITVRLNGRLAHLNIV